MLTKTIVKERLASNSSQFRSIGIDHIGLFGSFARGTAHEKSDIDLLVSFSPKYETFANFIAFCSLVDQIFQGSKVDVVTKNGFSPYIGPKILNEVEYVEIAH